MGLGLPSEKANPEEYARNLYDAALELYEGKQYGLVLEKVLPILMENDFSAPYLKEALFLRAVTFVEMAKELKNPIKYDVILKTFKEETDRNLYKGLVKYAVRDLSIIIKNYPEDEFAPKAAYQVGLIFELNGRNHIFQAMIVYAEIIKLYPDSPEKDLALKRLENIKSIYTKPAFSSSE